MGKTHILVPDAHAHPDFSNERFTWLGNLIADVKPDVVIQIGDLFDMPSLCSYDKGTKSFEGRRYWRDIESGVEAFDRIDHVLKKHKKKYPRRVFCLGNHEHRIVKAIDRDPVLEGTIGLDNLQSKEYGWEQYPFLTSTNIDGINYSHYFTSGVLGRPVPNARQLLIKQMASCSMGHDHRLDYVRQSNANGDVLNALVCGVFQDYQADYAGPANALWDRGVVIKRNVEGGNYDIEWVSLERLKQAYGT